MSYLRQSGIYCIRHADSGRMYIGSAVNLSRRFRIHRNLLKADRHHSPRLQHAWNQYGAEAFEFDVVEFVESREQLVSREQCWLDFFRAAEQGRGFNIVPVAGSTLGLRKSAEEVDAMRRRAKEQWGTPEGRAFRSKVAREFYAITENREHLSRKAKERLSSQTVRDAISVARKKYQENETAEHKAARSAAFVGKRHSDEARANMSAAQRSRIEREREIGFVRRHTPESIVKQSAAQKALRAREREAGIVRRASSETRAKIGAANKIAQQDQAVRAKSAATRLARKGT